MLKNYDTVPGQYAALLYVNCVVVDVRLKEIEPMAYNFLLNFARDNELVVRDGREVVREGGQKSAGNSGTGNSGA